MNRAPDWCSIKGEKLFRFRLFRLALLGIVVYAGGMECEIGTDAEVKTLVAAALEGRLMDEQAEVLAALGHGLLSLVL